MPDAFSAGLPARCGPLWSDCVDHPLMRSIREGSTPSDVMTTFLIQDYFFLDHFMKLMAGTLISAEGHASRKVYGAALGGLATSEAGFFDAALGQLGVDRGALATAVENDACRQFADLMEEAAATATYLAPLAVVCEANWLFAECAAKAAHVEEGSVHGLWLAQFGSPESRDFVAFLRRELDRVGPRDPELATRFFERACRAEKAFFDAVI